MEQEPPWNDFVGFLFSVAIITLPLFGMTWFFDQLSKDGAIGFPAYLLPGVIAVVTALFSSVVAATVAKRSSTNRLLLHTLFGCLASMLLLVLYCGGLAVLCFEFAERYRS